MKKKIVILGYGKISRKHIDALKNNKKKFEIVGICDTNKTKLKKINFKIRTFSSIKSLFKSKLDFDLVSICTPSGMHSSHTIEILKYGKHVLIEKPMSLNKKDGLKMIEISKKHKKKIFVCLQIRYNPAILELKKILSKKILGKIYLVNLNVFWNRSQKYYDQDKWRGTKNLDGGALMNQSIHFIDLLIWLFGDVKKQQIIRARLARNIETEDTALVNILFKNKTMCSFSSTMLVNKENYETSITIIGEKGTIKLGGASLDKIIDWKINNKEMTIEKRKKISSVNQRNKIYGHKKIYDDIFKYLSNKKSKAILAEDGIKSVEFIDKLYKENKVHI